MPFAQSPNLARRQKLVCDELIKCPDAKVTFGDPTDHLDVAQSAGTALYIGLEVVGRIPVTVMTRNLFLAFFGKELRRRPQLVRRHHGLHVLVQSLGAIEQARLD